MVSGAYCCNMEEDFPTHCENCNAQIDTLTFKGKGLPNSDKPHGHKDPRHKDGVFCSVKCAREDGCTGIRGIYQKK